MKVLNVEEMKNVTGGATYTRTCPNGCGYTVTSEYIGWSGLSKLTAAGFTAAKMYSHLRECTTNMCGI